MCAVLAALAALQHKLWAQWDPESAPGVIMLPEVS